MVKKAPISLCMIVKNEEAHLARCLESIKSYVSEIIIVDTGSTDKTEKIARKFATKYVKFTHCNYPDGSIRDFSSARQHSFDLATQPWVMWIDADDVVNGSENLPKMIADIDEKRQGQDAYVMLPYEYAHDDDGNCICLHYRERIVTKRDSFMWKGPVHEVLVSKPDVIVQSFSSETVRIIHERQKIKKLHDPNRNLRILKDYCADHSDDPRQFYYLGLEQSNVGDLKGAEETLKKYVQISGWDDEVCLAYMKLCELAFCQANYTDAIQYATNAVNVKPAWGECYFQLAKAYYYMSDIEKDQVKRYKGFEKCAIFSKIGLSCSPTKTVLFVNPLEREFEIHRYLNFALNQIGDVSSALDSVNIALLKKPNDEQLLGNKKIYEIHLAKVNYEQASKKLHELGIHSAENLTTNQIQNVSWKAYHRPPQYPRGVTQDDFPVAVITPHSQAWGIPNSKIVIDDLPLTMTDGQLQSLVAAVWKEYILHDEILSAIKFLENAPYRVRHTDETESMLRLTKNMIKWTADESTYDIGNSSLNGSDIGSGMRNTEMTPLNEPLVGAAAMRMRWISDRLTSQSSILDFGCIDGEMTNRWAKEGHSVTGLDICSNSIKIANESAFVNATGAKHIRTFFKDAKQHFSSYEKFDYVTCADTYEHITGDVVQELLVPMRELVKDDGRLLLVTPSGAWFRGLFCDYAHPWLWAETRGDHWLTPNDRSHVIAPTVWSVIENARKAGWWINNCTVVDQWHQDVPDQGNVCLDAIPDVSSPWPNNTPEKDIVFYVGDLAGEIWTPHTVDIHGIGGSETAVIEMSKRLVKLGNRVRVYTGCGIKGEGIYDGVEYLTTEKFHDIKCDVLVVSRWAPALDQKFNVDAKARYLWTHDVVPHQLTPELALRADKIFVLSQWHKNNVLTCCSYVTPDQIHVTRNGIDPARFTTNYNRDPHRVVYSSSPDRGLECLLDVWPEIKKIVPDARLEIFYGFLNWEKSANQDQLMLIQSIKNKIKSFEHLGVSRYDRVNQSTLASVFLQCGVWAYPTWFSETSCITAMEAQAAGLKIVTSPIAALNETVANRGIMIEGDWLSQDYRNRFINAVVSSMNSSSSVDRDELKEYAAKHFNWDDIASEWVEAFTNQLSSEENFPKYFSRAAE